MKTILTIVGARPQIIKAAAISRAIAGTFKDVLREIIVHTGQHYDENMSEVFFRELGIPQPDFNLHSGSGKHGAQTADMMLGLEKIFLETRPNCVLVYGDTNSTLAAAIVATKLHIPLVHVEAGLRSFNKKMPEEINRILCDHCSTLLFSPTVKGMANLEREGFSLHNDKPYSADAPGVFHCGDVMFDNSVHFAALAEERSDVLKRTELQAGQFILATIHRDHNTDIASRMNAIFSALLSLVEDNNLHLVLPLHPRTRKMMELNLDSGIKNSYSNHSHISIIPPVSFLDMICLEKNSQFVITDSGGVQKEAYFFRKPCIILRKETEWVELVENGNAVLADASPQKILDAFIHFSTSQNLTWPEIFGNGKASEFICATIEQHIR